MVINNEINVCSYQNSKDFEFLVTLLPSIKTKKKHNNFIKIKSNQIKTSRSLLRALVSRDVFKLFLKLTFLELYKRT